MANNSYLAFCFLLFAFFYDNVIAIRCISEVKNTINQRTTVVYKLLTLVCFL